MVRRNGLDRRSDDPPPALSAPGEESTAFNPPSPKYRSFLCLKEGPLDAWLLFAQCASPDSGAFARLRAEMSSELVGHILPGIRIGRRIDASGDVWPNL